ncbi:hypothetical protein [Streptosporangium amethystogenes]|uniref:hypothetical protein n=1 Tax=Streptosporangium amethystogenes TaxID=2002 RepID=UPI0004C8E6B4|nr:hypothetical protein [Streptosporangium amethystogenes]
MTLVDTTSRHEPAEETGALHALALRFTGWLLWYGKATGRYWALSPIWCREHIGLIEADTPTELAAQMQHIEDFRRHLAPGRPLSKQEVPLPESSTDVKVAGNTEHNGIESKGGDRDGSAPVVRARRRTR